MKELLSLGKEGIGRLINSMGEQPYRAKQLYAGLMKGYLIGEITGLSKELRERLADEFTEGLPGLILERASSDGTRKYLFRLGDGCTVESVLLRYSYGDTVCASTQVGCAMGCSFCMSCKDGLTRDLEAHEIYGQCLAINRALGSPGSRSVKNVVLMGSGEPLDNFEGTMGFLKLVSSGEGLGMSMRNVSVSTCGITPKILELADSGFAPTLCVSLHAPNDGVRKTIMPAAKAYSIEKIIEACRYYFKKTGRRIIIEYALIEGVNASPGLARELSLMLTGLNCHINLIALNGCVSGHKAPGKRVVEDFKGELARRGMSVSVRRSLGRDIEGACGQLKAGYENGRGAGRLK